MSTVMTYRPLDYGDTGGLETLILSSSDEWQTVESLAHSQNRGIRGNAKGFGFAVAPTLNIEGLRMCLLIR